MENMYEALTSKDALRAMTLSRWRHATKRLARRAVALDGGAEDVADTDRDHLVAMAWCVTENLMQ